MQAGAAEHQDPASFKYAGALIRTACMHADCRLLLPTQRTADRLHQGMPQPHTELQYIGQSPLLNACCRDYASAGFIPAHDEGKFDYVAVDGRSRMLCLQRALQLIKPEARLLPNVVQTETAMCCFNLLPSRCRDCPQHAMPSAAKHADVPCSLHLTGRHSAAGQLRCPCALHYTHLHDDMTCTARQLAGYQRTAE